MSPQKRYERLMKKAAKHTFSYTIAWMKVMNAISKAQQKEQEQREWNCNGYLGKRLK